MLVMLQESLLKGHRVGLNSSEQLLKKALLPRQRRGDGFISFHTYFALLSLWKLS